MYLYLYQYLYLILVYRFKSSKNPNVLYVILKYFKNLSRKYRVKWKYSLYILFFNEPKYGEIEYINKTWKNNQVIVEDNIIQS